MTLSRGLTASADSAAVARSVPTYPDLRGKVAVVAGGSRGIGASAAYTRGKAGVVTLSKHLASEVGRHGIRVDCVAPSAIRTERVARAMPDDVAPAIVYLVSDGAAWPTGVTFDVGGGRIMR